MNIENRVGIELEEMKVDEEEHILPVMMQVTVGKRKADLQLDRGEFFGKLMKRKQAKHRKLETATSSATSEQE